MNLFVAVLFLITPLDATGQNDIMLVIHGGAGSMSPDNMSAEKQQIVQQTLTQIFDVGYEMLKSGATAKDAVETVVKLMENSPHFNAGRGSVTNSAGKVEMDAAFMDGKTGLAGAVAGVRRVKNPVSAARAVMERTPHVLMFGEGAEAVAREAGLEFKSPAYFLNKTKDGQRGSKITDGWNPDYEIQAHKFGTVGAVALDKNGDLCAATSTGGMQNKRIGRVGDSPIIGASTYAKNGLVAVSTTGHGEFFIRNAVAFDIAALMEYKNLSVEEAVKTVLNKLDKQGGQGGIIAIDGQGRPAAFFNTPGMYRAYKDATGKTLARIFPD
jgi:beta-aspartyl-peptidase (threonine type)